MDTAKAAPAEINHEAAAGDPPAIGVPSIPVPADQTLRPLAVPSLTLPAPLPSSSLQLTPVPPIESPPSTAGRLAARGPTPAGTSQGFAPGVSAKLHSYVYLLIDPRTGRAFYVGQGRADRCFRHVAAAHRDPSRPVGEGTDHQPKFPMLDRIREVESGGCAVRVDILRYGLSRAEASVVEAAVHEALGLSPEPKLGSQRRSAVELDSKLAKRAKFRQMDQVVLLRVGASGSDHSYETARHGWRIGRRWTDLDSPRSPQWAVVVVADLIATVYRIDGWEADRPATTAGPIDRYSFVGWRDPAMEDRYRGRSVSSYLGRGGQSPVTYVWCGPHWVNTPR